MNREYFDILEKLGPPLWWDDQAVPRYKPFHPNLCGIYDNEVALCVIKCQSCGQEFRVAFAWYRLSGEPSLTHILQQTGELYYRDPPNNDCCASGPTMTSEFKEVLEFWIRNCPTGWVKVEPPIKIEI